jgi:methylase of polypeptide subunit release factors
MASYIMSKALEYHTSENISVLDIGSGSGILSLCLGDEKYKIHGMDINPCAVKCAKINARLNGIKNANFWVQDLSTVDLFQYPCELIIFNPPFVFMPKAEKTLHSFGGTYGIEIALKILHNLNQNIRDGGDFLGIVQSPVFSNQDIPILIEKSHKFSNLAITFEIVGEMPPFEKYLDFYRKYDIKKIVVMVVSGKVGNEIILTRNNDYMKKFCFS